MVAADALPAIAVMVGASPEMTGMLVTLVVLPPGPLLLSVSTHAS